MRYRGTRPLQELLNVALSGMPPTQSLQALVMQAWYQILPRTQGQLQRTFVKHKALYVKPHSPLLKHELYLQRSQIHQQLQATLQTLGGDPNAIEDIFFI